MTRNDRAALKLALALCRNESPGRAQQIDSMLEDQPWAEVATFAAFCCQSRSLHLDPWQEPPCCQSDVQAYYYKSREDFKGEDRFVVEVFFPTGNYRKRLFTIDVR